MEVEHEGSLVKVGVEGRCWVPWITLARVHGIRAVIKVITDVTCIWYYIFSGTVSFSTTDEMEPSCVRHLGFKGFLP